MSYDSGVPLSRAAQKKVLLEQLKWSVSAALGSDYNHAVRFDETFAYKLAHFAATVEARLTSRELLDEREEVQVPLTDWDRTKAGLNGLLGTLDRWLEGHGIVPWGRRFKVRTGPLALTRVYHVCPHKSSGVTDHLTWLVCPAGGDDRLDFRHAHRIREIAEGGLRDPGSAANALYTIRRILNDTGAFGR